MWVKPGYEPPAGQAQEYEDKGQRLATLERSRGDEELRVSFDEYDGNHFIQIRVWMRDRQSGRFVPTKRGATVRRSELQAVLAALQEGAALFDRNPGPMVPPADTRPSGSPPRREPVATTQGPPRRGGLIPPGRPASRAGNLPAPSNDRDFDEFGD